MFKLNKKLKILEHDFVRVKLAWCLRLFFQVGFVIAWTIVTALFVENFGIAKLVFLFLIEAGLFIFGTILASFVLARISLKKYLLGTILLTLVFLSIALQFTANDFYFFVFVILAKDLFFAQLNIALYRQNEILFSPAVAQKVMPIIESAITIGTILGAFLTVEFLKFTETEFVLILWGLFCFILGGIVILAPKILQDVPHFVRPQKLEKKLKNPIIEGFTAIRRIPFLKFITLILIIQSAVFTVIEYNFTVDVQKHISHKNELHTSAPMPLYASFFDSVKNEFFAIKESATQKFTETKTKLIAQESLAHDLGMLHLFFGLLALVVQILITPKVLNKFGVIGSILAYLVILVIGFISLIFGKISIGTMRAIQHGTHSIGEAPYHISYYSIFEHSRESIRLLLEGIIKPLGIALGGTMIFFLPTQINLIIGAIAMIGIIFSFNPFRKVFTNLSKENLKSNDNISDKLHSIEVLKQKGHLKASAILGSELSNKLLPTIVREKIIETLSEVNDPQIVHIYSEILANEEEPESIKINILASTLKINSLKNYLDNRAFAQNRFLETCRNLFENSSHSHIKKLAVMNLFRSSPTREIVPFFIEKMSSSDEKSKSIFLRSLQDFDDPDLAFFLRPFLGHQSVRIKGHAIIALWNFTDKQELRNLIQELLQGDKASQISGIYAIGEIKDKKNESELFQFKTHQDQQIRLHSNIALAKLENKHCLPGLLEIIFGTDLELSRAAIEMLKRAPQDIRDKISKEVHHEVSRRVNHILLPQKIHRFEDLSRLPKSAIATLKRLYGFTQKYDDILLMDSLMK